MSEPRLLRPMEFGDLFNEGFDLYKRNFLLFAGIGAVVYIPYYLATAFISAYPALIAVALLLFLPMVAASGAVVKALADRYLNRETSIADAWRYIWRRMVPFSLTGTLAMLLLSGGVLLFCVPGIIVAFWVYFVWAVMIVEERYYTAAIQRSRELAAGQWFRIFIVALLTFGVMLGVYAVVGTMLSFLLIPMVMRDRSSGDLESVMMVYQVAQSIVTGIIQTVVSPFCSVLSVLLYFDVRVRKEGFDVELLAQELGAPPPEVGPTFDLS